MEDGQKREAGEEEEEEGAGGQPLFLCLALKHYWMRSAKRCCALTNAAGCTCVASRPLGDGGGGGDGDTIHACTATPFQASGESARAQRGDLVCSWRSGGGVRGRQRGACVLLHAAGRGSRPAAPPPAPGLFWQWIACAALRAGEGDAPASPPSPRSPEAAREARRDGLAGGLARGSAASPGGGGGDAPRGAAWAREGPRCAPSATYISEAGGRAGEGCGAWRVGRGGRADAPREALLQRLLQLRREDGGRAAPIRALGARERGGPRACQSGSGR